MTVPFILDPVLGLRIIRKRTGRPAKLTGGGVSVARLTGASDLTVTVETPPSGATAYRVFCNQKVEIIQALPGRSVAIPLSRFYGEATPPSTVPVQVKPIVDGKEASRGFAISVTEEAPSASAPTVSSAPEIQTATIGEPAGVIPGVYANMTGYTPTVEWLVNGVVVATTSSYTPQPADDGLNLIRRETATNNVSSVVSSSDPLEIAYPEPQAVFVAPNLSVVQGTEDALFSVAEWFTIFDEASADAPDYEGELAYSVTGTGASINATTGLLTLTFSALRTDDTVTITATNSGGSAEIAFDVTVTEAVVVEDFPAPVADSLWSIVEARTLSPVGRRTWSVDISVTVPTGFTLEAYSGREQNGGPQTASSTVTPGTPDSTAGGYPVGTLLYNLLAWKRTSDGAWGGLTTQRQFTVQGAYPAPTVIAPLPDITLTQDDPDPVLDGAAVFYATSDYQGSTFSVTGSGASINSSTGALTIDTASVLTDEAIEVTATNASGSDSDTFLLTVTATPGSEPFPAVLADNKWTSHEERDLAPEGRNYVLVDSSVDALYDNTKFDLLWSPTTNPDGVPEWAIAQTPGTAYRTNSQSAPGTVIWSMLFWRRKVGGAVQLASNKFSWTMQGLNVQPPSGQLVPFSTGTMNKVIGSGKYSTKVTSGREVSRSPANHGPTPIMVALQVMTGGATSQVETRLTDQIDWSLIGDKCLIANSGYGGQYDQHHVGLFSLAKNIPSVWNGLTATKKNKIDTLMKAHVIAQAWACSDKTAKYPGTAATHYDLRGNDKYKRTWAPNFRVPMIGGLLTAVPYFGSPEAIQSYLDNFSTSQIDGLRTNFTNFGLSNPKTIWDRIGVDPDAPTKAELVTAVNGFRYYGKALTTANIMSLILGESAILWNRTFSPGYRNTGDITSNTGLGGYGVYYDGVLCGSTLDRSNPPAWYGETGMANELDTVDGGASCNGNKKAPRSAMSYAVDGARAELMYLAVLGATGFISSEYTGMSTVTTRVFKGWRDFQDKTDRQFKSTSKGQCAAGGRESWYGSFPEGTYLFSAAKDFADWIVDWLG